MVISVAKFGTILNGRPAGREAALVLKQRLATIPEQERLVFDFSGVVVLTPSYADEFLRPVMENAAHTVQAINITSAVIHDSLSAIGFPFRL